MTPTQENHALTSGYIKLWRKKYPNDPPPNFNVNKAQFGWKAMRMTMSIKEIQELVEFFFTLNDDRYRHDLHQFHWDYDKVVEKMRTTLKDRKHREVLAKQSELKTKEFEERIARIKNNQRNPE